VFFLGKKIRERIALSQFELHIHIKYTKIH